MEYVKYAKRKKKKFDWCENQNDVSCQYRVQLPAESTSSAFTLPPYLYLRANNRPFSTTTFFPLPTSRYFATNNPIPFNMTDIILETPGYIIMDQYQCCRCRHQVKKLLNSHWEGQLDPDTCPHCSHEFYPKQGCRSTTHELLIMSQILTSSRRNLAYDYDRRRDPFSRIARIIRSRALVFPEAFDVSVTVCSSDSLIFRAPIDFVVQWSLLAWKRTLGIWIMENLNVSQNPYILIEC